MWKLIILLFLIHSSKGDLNNFELSKHSSSLTEAITDIIFNFYVIHSTTVNIIFSSEDKSSFIEIHDAINEVLSKLTDIIVDLEDHLAIRISRRKKEYIVIFCDSFISFQKVFLQMRHHNFKYQGFYLIAITKYSTSEDIDDVMSKIFESLWSLQIVNANILWMENQNKSMMYTYFPYTSFYCSEAYPALINQFQNGKWLTGIEYFPCIFPRK